MGAAHGRGGVPRAGFQPPPAGSRHVKASHLKPSPPPYPRKGVFSVHLLFMLLCIELVSS
jgi:hypothetical protein